MALGLVFGPIMGGTLLAAGSETTLGMVAAGVVTFGSCLLLHVDRKQFVVVRQCGTWSQSRALALARARASVDSTQQA